jgi:Ankyrin repeats (many copies)
MGHVEVVHALIQDVYQVDVNVNVKPNDVVTALWIASHNAHVKVVCALLQDDWV